MKAFPPLPFVVLDTETTGFVPRVHRVIEFACVTLEEGNVVAEHEQLFRIDEEIPPLVQVLTHIRLNDLASAPRLEEMRDTVMSWIPEHAIIVGQNIRFDLDMLKGEGIDLTARPWIDTAMLAPIVFPELKSYSLGFVSDALKLPHEPKHRALGDVRATAMLLAACFERFTMLPAEAQDIIKNLATKGPPGYKKFFEALPGVPSSKKALSLKVPAPEKFTHRTHKGLAACAEQKQGLELVEEPLDPGWLENFLDALAERATTEPTIVAVKNIEQTIRRQHISPSISILEPPAHIVDPEAVARLLAEPSFSPSELTLAIKLYLYAPTRRLDIPIHGDEYDVWAAKVACTEASAAYETLKSHRRSTCVMSHEQCLRGLMKGELKNHRIIIDDASMLEEAVSKAFGCDCGIAFLRAASTGNDALMKITDLIALWVEKVRANEDVHYITKADLALRETKGLLERLDAALALPLPAQTIDCLKNLRAILDDTNLPGRITYIETMMNGDHALHSVPDDIASLLRDRLYREAPTSLFVPQGSASMLRAIVTNDVPTILHSPNDTTSVSLEYTKDWEMRSWMENITGKAVLLVSSRRAIEDIFVKYTELLEALDITLLCQGTSGGASRLVGSFAGAKGKTILVVTPWMYEGFDLPPGSIDELVLNAIPFDHPHHAIYSQRGKRFAPQEFEHYTLPRTMHRMFRLLRAFCRHRKDDARFLITDERLTSRNYGPTIQSYLDRVTRSKSNEEEVSTDTTAETPKSPVKKEGKSATKNARKESANPNQQTLFGETEF